VSLPPVTAGRRAFSLTFSITQRPDHRQVAECLPSPMWKRGRRIRSASRTLSAASTSWSRRSAVSPWGIEYVVAASRRTQVSRSVRARVRVVDQFQVGAQPRPDIVLAQQAVGREPDVRGLRGAEQSAQAMDAQSGSERAQRRNHLAGNGGGGVFQQRADGIGSRHSQASQSADGLRTPARQRMGQ